jgi:hypothetical protein
VTSSRVAKPAGNRTEHLQEGKGKGKVLPRTGHEGPEGE